MRLTDKIRITFMAVLVAAVTIVQTACVDVPVTVENPRSTTTSTTPPGEVTTPTTTTNEVSSPVQKSRAISYLDLTTDPPAMELERTKPLTREYKKISRMVTHIAGEIVETLPGVEFTYQDPDGNWIHEYTEEVDPATFEPCAQIITVLVNSSTYESAIKVGERFLVVTVLNEGYSLNGMAYELQDDGSVIEEEVNGVLDPAFMLSLSSMESAEEATQIYAAAMIDGFAYGTQEMRSIGWFSETLDFLASPFTLLETGINATAGVLNNFIGVAGQFGSQFLNWATAALPYIPASLNSFACIQNVQACGQSMSVAGIAGNYISGGFAPLNQQVLGGGGGTPVPGSGTLPPPPAPPAPTDPASILLERNGIGVFSGTYQYFAKSSTEACQYYFVLKNSSPNATLRLTGITSTDANLSFGSGMNTGCFLAIQLPVHTYPIDIAPLQSTGWVVLIKETAPAGIYTGSLEIAYEDGMGGTGTFTIHVNANIS